MSKFDALVSESAWWSICSHNKVTIQHQPDERKGKCTDQYQVTLGWGFRELILKLAKQFTNIISRVIRRQLQWRNRDIIAGNTFWSSTAQKRKRQPQGSLCVYIKLHHVLFQLSLLESEKSKDSQLVLL